MAALAGAGTLAGASLTAGTVGAHAHMMIRAANEIPAAIISKSIFSSGRVLVGVYEPAGRVFPGKTHKVHRSVFVRHAREPSPERDSEAGGGGQAPALPDGLGPGFDREDQGEGGAVGW